MNKIHKEILVVKESEMNNPEVKKQIWLTPNVFVSDENGEFLQPLTIRSSQFEPNSAEAQTESEPNVQAQPPAVASGNLETSEETFPATAGCPAAPCSASDSDFNALENHLDNMEIREEISYSK